MGNFIALLTLAFLLAVGCASSTPKRYTWEDKVEKMEEQLQKLSAMYRQELREFAAQLNSEAITFGNMQGERLERGEITKAEYDFLMVQKKNELIGRLTAKTDQIEGKVEKAYNDYKQFLESIAQDLAREKRSYTPPPVLVQPPKRSFNCTSNAIGNMVFTDCY